MLKRDKAKVLVRMEVLVTDDRQSLLAIFCCCLLSTQVHLPRLTHSTEQRLVISHDLFIWSLLFNICMCYVSLDNIDKVLGSELN